MLLFFVLSASLSAQDRYATISNAIKTNNVKELAKHFNKRLDITIDDNENNYSSEQASIVVKNFLSGFPAREFNIIHKGNADDKTEYIIGKLSYKTIQYKAYIFLKLIPESFIIQEISFEKE